MTIGMDFHDARLLELVCNSDGGGHALLRACIFKSNGIVFEDAQESGWQNCRLVFQGMRVQGTPAELGAYASEGDMRVDGKSHGGLILLPADYQGSIQINLVLSPLFETLTIHAQRITSLLEGPWELEATWE
ncbi:MAG: hypothetical protein KGK08_04920 [Acidobacteriota bacterium]|nr:hypothetical protein [Acidobacteriota bacterium]